MSKEQHLKHANLHVEHFDFSAVRDKELCAPVEVLRETVEVKSGLPVKSYKMEKTDPRDNFKSWKVSDFYMENLQAIGAVGNLKLTMYGDVDVDAFSSGLDAFTDSLENDK